MINYLSHFVPSMSDLTTPLRKLLKRDVLFQWMDSHEEAFQKLQDSISSDMCLQYCDTTKPVTLQYIPGPKIHMADALSTVIPHEKVEIKGLDVTINELTPIMS